MHNKMKKSHVGASGAAHDPRRASPTRMNQPRALFVTMEAIRRDSALYPGGPGARKILVAEIYPNKEEEAVQVRWQPPIGPAKCPVQIMKDTEVAVFTHRASQDRHYHKSGTEIYMVLEGQMTIEVEGEDYSLSLGDMIAVNPGAVHEVKLQGTRFICRVVTVKCGGASDKYVVSAQEVGRGIQGRR